MYIVYRKGDSCIKTKSRCSFHVSMRVMIKFLIFVSLSVLAMGWPVSILMSALPFIFASSVVIFVMPKPYYFALFAESKMVIELNGNRAQFHLRDPFVLKADKRELVRELERSVLWLRENWKIGDIAISTPAFCDDRGNPRTRICQLTERILKSTNAKDVKSRIIAKPWFNFSRMVLLIKVFYRRLGGVNSKYFYEVRARF